MSPGKDKTYRGKPLDDVTMGSHDGAEVYELVGT